MQRYSIPFKDYVNNSYEVRIYIEGYTGEVAELTGARSAFVVTASDVDFAYEPLRTSTATLTIVDSHLLLDLFSINNQYAPVKLYKNGVLTWTGYITPEQFTQPYVSTPDSISIDCVSAMGTLENIKYEKQVEGGFITAMDLLRYIIRSANGGYNKIYIPHVYASSSANYSAKKCVLDEIKLAEENFISEERTLDEVLTFLLRFFAWSMYDQEGDLYFIDPDWKGEYHAYNEGLTEYTIAHPNEILIQNLSYAGNGHSIDVLPGYNKVSVKAINNVFDKLVVDEDFADLAVIQGPNGNPIVPDADNGGNTVCHMLYLKPGNWETKLYKNGEAVKDLETVKNSISSLPGAVPVRFCIYDMVNKDGKWTPNISDYNYTNAIRVKKHEGNATTAGNKTIGPSVPILTIKGPAAVYSDGAFSISGSAKSIRDNHDIWPFGNTVHSTENIFYAKLIIGDKSYDSDKKNWVNGSYGNIKILYTEDGVKNGDINGDYAEFRNTKTLVMPYDGLKGLIMETGGQELSGELEFILYGYEGESSVVGTAIGTAKGMYIKDFKLSFQKKNGIVEEGEDGDRVYENVVNEKFMNPLDEIEFGISSYNADGATYSKALLNGKFLTDNLYSAVEGKLIRPEEAFIRRVIKRYQATQIKLTQVVKNSDLLHPFTILSDNSMVSKKFMMIGGIWDYESNNVQLAMTENGGN